MVVSLHRMSKDCCVVIIWAPAKTSDILEQLHQDIDTWYHHETLRNDRGDTKNDDSWYTCSPDFLANIKSSGTMRDTQKTMTISATSFRGCNRFSPLLICRNCTTLHMWTWTRSFFRRRWPRFRYMIYVITEFAVCDIVIQGCIRRLTWFDFWLPQWLRRWHQWWITAEWRWGSIPGGGSTWNAHVLPVFFWFVLVM